MNLIVSFAPNDYENKTRDHHEKSNVVSIFEYHDNGQFYQQ